MSSYLYEARRTLVLAGPIIIGQVSTMLMGLTDALMIGHVGKVPLAASAFAGNLFGMSYMIVIGLMIPISIMVARAHGGGDETDTSEWMRHGVWLATAAASVATLVMLGLGTQLHRFGQPTEVLATVQPYYTLIVVSVVPAILFQVMAKFSESLERPFVPMVLTLAGVGLNVLLNWVFIYGNWGSPALGLAGAGWATLISRVVGVVVIIAWIRRTPSLQASWPRRWFGNLQWHRFKRLLALGIPVSFSLSFEAGAFSASAIMMGWISSTALAAHQIAISCAAATFMFPLGLAMAVSMRVGRAVGAGRLTALRAIGNTAQIISAVFMGGFAILFVVSGPAIASAFVKEVEVIELAAQLLIIAAIFQLADGAQVVAANALRGLTDMKIPTVICAIAYWVLGLPIGWFLCFKLDWSGQGIWAGLALGLTLAAVALMARFHHMTRDDGAHVVREKPAEQPGV